jgi:hypothetical protein
MSSYVQEVEEQNEKLREKLSRLEERFDGIFEGGVFITTLNIEKVQNFAEVDLSEVFGVPKHLINSMHKKATTFTLLTLDSSVLHILMNRQLGSAVYNHRLWTIDCDDRRKTKKFSFSGTIYLSSDLQTIYLQDDFEGMCKTEDRNKNIVDRVKKLIAAGDYELDENGMARLD